MKIIRIAPQKFKKEYITVFSTGDEPFKLHREVAAQYRLQENMDIEPEKLAQIKTDSEKKEAFEYALLFLSYRSRTAREMAIRLERKGFRTEVIHEVLDKLKTQKLIDDLQFAKNFSESSIRNRLHGSYRIQRELFQKGVDKKIVEKVTQDMKTEQGAGLPDEEERAYQLILRRSSQSKNLDPHTAYRRLHSFLLRRGFSYDVVEKAMNRYRRGVEPSLLKRGD